MLYFALHVLNRSSTHPVPLFRMPPIDSDLVPETPPPGKEEDSRPAAVTPESKPEKTATETEPVSTVSQEAAASTPRNVSPMEIPALTDAWASLEPYLGVIQRAENQKPGFRRAIQQAVAQILPLLRTGEIKVPPIPKPARHKSSSPRRLPPTSSSSSSSSSSESSDTETSASTPVKGTGAASKDSSRSDKTSAPPKGKKPAPAENPVKNPMKKGAGKTQRAPSSSTTRKSLTSGSSSSTQTLDKDAEKSRVPTKAALKELSGDKKTTKVVTKRTAKPKAPATTRIPKVSTKKESASSDLATPIRTASPLENLYSSMVENPAARKKMDKRGKGTPSAKKPPVNHVTDVVEATSTLPDPRSQPSTSAEPEKSQNPQVRLARLNWAPKWLRQVEEANAQDDKGKPPSDNDCLVLEVADQDRVGTNSSASDSESQRVAPATITVAPTTAVIAAAPRVRRENSSSEVPAPLNYRAVKIVAAPGSDLASAYPATSTSADVDSAANFETMEVRPYPDTVDAVVPPPALLEIPSTPLPRRAPFCYKCRRRGHAFRDCPSTEQREFCHKCGRLDVLTGDCPCHGPARTGQRRFAEDPASPAQRTIRPALTRGSEFGSTLAQDPLVRRELFNDEPPRVSTEPLAFTRISAHPSDFVSPTGRHLHPLHSASYYGALIRSHDRSPALPSYPREDLRDRLSSGPAFIPTAEELRWLELQRYAAEGYRGYPPPSSRR